MPGPYCEAGADGKMPLRSTIDRLLYGDLDWLAEERRIRGVDPARLLSGARSWARGSQRRRRVIGPYPSSSTNRPNSVGC